MQRSDFAEYAAFVAIVEHGGFARAGAKLGITSSAVSQALSKLEARLGVRLLNRTTRSVQPTSAGRQLAEKLRIGFELFEHAVAAARDSAGDTTGSVRLTVSAVIAELVIAPNLAAFQHRYPGVKLDVSVNERLVDIVAERFDAGIRRADLLQADMVSSCLSPRVRMLAVASPDYVVRHAAIREPKDLRDHNCVRIRRLRDGAILPWRFALEQTSLDLKVDGMTAVDTTTLALAAAVEGAGVAYLASDYLRQHLESGRLVPVLDEWAATRPGFHLFHSGRRQVPAVVRLLGKFLRSRVAAVPDSFDRT